MPEYIFPKSITGPEPQNLSIFALKPARLTERAVAEVARRFGLAGDERETIVVQHPDWMSLAQGRSEVRVHRGSGGWRYRNHATWQVDDGTSNLEMRDAEGAALAMKHVDQFALADPRECHLLKVTRLHVGVTERATGYAEERVIDLGVAVQRTIDGVAVEGPGGKIVIYLDHEGAVTGVDRLWRDIEDRVQPVSRLVPLQAALDDLVEQWGREGPGQVLVEEARLAYFELGWEHAQEYLQPAYILPLRITSGGDRPFVRRSEHVFPAAENAVGTLIPRTRRPTQQERRTTPPSYGHETGAS